MKGSQKPSAERGRSNSARRRQRLEDKHFAPTDRHIPAATSLRVCPKSSPSQTKLSEHEANRGEAEKSECVSGEIFKILGHAATAIEPSEGAFDDPPPW